MSSDATIRFRLDPAKIRRKFELCVLCEDIRILILSGPEGRVGRNLDLPEWRKNEIEKHKRSKSLFLEMLDSVPDGHQMVSEKEYCDLIKDIEWMEFMINDAAKDDVRVRRLLNEQG